MAGKFKYIYKYILHKFTTSVDWILNLMIQTIKIQQKSKGC